jgi:hypothetical protein
LKGQVSCSNIAVDDATLLPWVPATPEYDIDLGGSGINLPQGQSVLHLDPRDANGLADNRALRLFADATGFEAEQNTENALKSYALAVEVIRSDRSKHDPKSIEAVVTRYISLLRKNGRHQNGTNTEEGIFAVPVAATDSKADRMMLTHGPIALSNLSHGEWN